MGENAQVMGYRRHGDIALAQLTAKQFFPAVGNVGIDAEARWVAKRLGDQRRLGC